MGGGIVLDGFGLDWGLVDIGVSAGVAVVAALQGLAQIHSIQGTGNVSRAAGRVQGWAQARSFLLIGVVFLLGLVGATVTSCEQREAAADERVTEERHRKSLTDLRASNDVLHAEQAATRAECAESKALSGRCAAAFNQGRPYADYYNQLSPEQQREYPVPECGSLPTWREGAAQLRVAAWPTAALAQENIDEIKRILLVAEEDLWLPHLMRHPVESHAEDDKTQKLWIGAILRVEPAFAARTCAWLKCRGVDVGHASCGVRNVHGTRK